MHHYTSNRVARASLATLTLFALAFGMFSFSLITSTSIANANADGDQTCSSITLNSSTSTLTAGYTQVNPVSAPVALQPSAYSHGSLVSASTTQTVIPPWVDPATDPNFSTSSAVWVSSDPTWPGGTNNTEGSPLNDQWRLFQDSFTLPAGAVVTNATLWYTADNAAAVYLNGGTSPIATTNTGTTSEDVYGTTPSSGPQNFGQVFTTNFSPVVGNNTLSFVVRNWSTVDSATNPTGLLYTGVVNYCVPGEPENPPMVTVTIDKYIDGQQATASSSGNLAFPMTATWNSTSTGSGSGEYTLSSTGFNSSNPYEAITAQMTKGASYSTNEMTGGDVVGLTCGTSSQPYSLVGYTTGNSKAQAAVGTPTTTPPSFTNMTHDMYVIVWNHACSGTTGGLGGEVVGSQGVLHVDSIDAVKVTATADNTFANGWKYVFHITAPNNEPKLAMKFADWFNASASSTIPAGGNMQVSSAQSSNPGPISITAANVYSSPMFNMVTDLDPGTLGRQVEVTVEVKIPVGSANGPYTTTYGVQTLP